MRKAEQEVRGNGDEERRGKERRGGRDWRGQERNKEGGVKGRKRGK